MSATEEEGLAELRQYIGLPMCQDCGWKLGSDLTNTCDCTNDRACETRLLHQVAYFRARQLQVKYAHLL